MTIDTMINSMNKKIMDWNDYDADGFVASFSNEEIMLMIDEMEIMRFSIDRDYFIDGGKVNAYLVVSNYIRRWTMEEVEDCQVDTARKLLDKLQRM